jgi:hypothetical protein
MFFDSLCEIFQQSVFYAQLLSNSKRKLRNKLNAPKICKSNLTPNRTIESEKLCQIAKNYCFKPLTQVKRLINPLDFPQSSNKYVCER